MLNNFADEIKSIRESKNLSIQQVAVKTRIDSKFLESMERGDFEFLPELYVNSFLKEYLRALNLDEQLYMKKYEAAKTGRTYEDTPPVEKPVENIPEIPKLPQTPAPPPPSKKSQFDAVREYKHREEESSASRKRKQQLTIYLTVAVVAAAGILYLLFFRESDEVIIPEKSWEEIVEDTRERYEENTDTLADSIALINTDSLSLTIRATDTTWLKIVLDDSRTEEFILFPGSQKSMKTKNDYKLVVGNTRGVKFDLNGRALTINSQVGNVQHIQIDSNGIKNIQETAGQ